jgi:hypothetical protein
MHGQFTSHIKFSDLHVYINVKIHGTYVIWDEARKTAKYYNWWIAEHTNHYTTDAILYLQEVKKNSISIKYLRIYLDNYSQFVSNYDHWLVIGQGSGWGWFF